MQIPILINNRDRYTPLKALVTWLLARGYSNIHIIDNDSKYRPLLRYYDRLDKGSVRIVYLDKNEGSRCLWHLEQLQQIVRDGPFILSDSDIVPREDCPDDLIETLARISTLYPEFVKIGVGLEIEDLPEHYAKREEAHAWESQHWSTVFGEFEGTKLYTAGTATTFAYYPRFGPFDYSALRTGYPYVARHTDWYIDSSHPTREQVFYDNRAVHGTWHNWGVFECYSNAVANHCGKET